MTRRLAWAGAAALGVLLLSGCGEEPGFDAGPVEAYLAESQASVFGADAEVGDASCPGDHTLKNGMELACTLEVADASVPYRVTLRDVRSERVAISVALDGVVLRGADIAEFVRKQLPKAFRSATIDCGPDLVVSDVDETLECTVRSGAQTKTVVVTVMDEAGRVSIS